MRQLVVSEWITLDGVFDAETMKDWFKPYDSPERQAHIAGLVLGSDAFLFGRVTYEMLAGYWPKVKDDDPEIEIARKLNSAPKYVVSSTLRKGDWNNSIVIRDNVADEIATLKQQPGRSMLVFGSATLVEALMKQDLVDEYRILVHPIVMGTGKRSFRDGMATTKLKLVETKTFGAGVLSLCYRPAGRL